MEKLFHLQRLLRLNPFPPFSTFDNFLLFNSIDTESYNRLLISLQYDSNKRKSAVSISNFDRYSITEQFKIKYFLKAALQSLDSEILSFAIGKNEMILEFSRKFPVCWFKTSNSLVVELLNFFAHSSSNLGQWHRSNVCRKVSKGTT